MWLHSSEPTCGYHVWNPRVVTLLGNRDVALPVRDEPGGDGAHASGLSRHAVGTPGQALALLHSGIAHRATAATLCNDVSSRSHAVFTVHVEQRWPDSASREPCHRRC